MWTLYSIGIILGTTIAMFVFGYIFAGDPDPREQPRKRKPRDMR